MDDDDGLYLAENISGSNTDDDNEIDSDLEDQLYAAVFHSNEISSRKQEIAGYNNFTSLTDIIGCWKNIPQEENSDLLFSKQIATSEGRTESIRFSACDEGGKIYSSNENAYNENRCNNFEENGRLKSKQALGRSGEKFIGSQVICSEDNLDNGNYNVLRDTEETGIDIYSEREMQTGIATIQNKTTSDKEQVNSSTDVRRSPRSDIMKEQQNHSPKKSSKSKYYSKADNFAQKQLATDNTSDRTHPLVHTELSNNSAVLSVPEDTTESSEIKAEVEFARNKFVGTETTVSLLDNGTSGLEEDLDKPLRFLPEEKLGVFRSKDSEALTNDCEQIADVKPEEEKEKIEEISESMDNRTMVSLSNLSSSNLSSEDSSPSSSGGDTQDLQNPEDKGENFCPGNDENEIIILDDSEGSICEVPVPPKPRPLTIDLEDSESSSSSSSSSSEDDDDINTKIMTPEKLVKSYKNAVSKSKSSNRETRRAKATPEKNMKNPSIQNCSSTSDSDDSMTESEHENWGIITESQMNKGKSTPISDTSNTRVSEISGINSPPEMEWRDNDGEIIRDENETADSIFEERENSGREPAEISKKIGSDLTADKQLGEVGESLPIMDPGNKEQEKDDIGNDEIIIEDDTLIMNTENARGLSDLEETRESLEILTRIRTPESRKRSMNDSGKKNRHQNSSKKAKSSDEIASPTVSRGKSNRSRTENNKNKDRNCAADYFFKPMSNDMENYYNKSWGGENFDVDSIRSQMPRDPRHWSILNEDLLGYQQRRSRYWTESKCRNCNLTGHRVAECPEKRKLPSCHMCGTPGHKEPRCPHKMCLGCGKKQKTYMQVCKDCRRAWCNGCQSYGHVDESCPDLWRRYHGTTSHRDVNTNARVEAVMKPQHLLSCCNCAKRGHDSTTCDNYRWSRHFPTPAYVSNYNTGPDYVQEPVRSNLGSNETREQNDRGKKKTDSEIAHTITSSNDGRMRRSDNDDKECETENDPGVYIVLEKYGKSPEAARVGESLTIEPKKSNQDAKTQKNCKQIVLIDSSPKNLTKKNDEVLFTLTSKLLDNNFTHLANFGERNFPLLHEECKGLVESDLSTEFLQNLTAQFPMKIEIKRSSIGQITMTIASTKDLHLPIHITIMDWLNWQSDEQSRFINLSLPTTTDELVKLLSDKLHELERNLGNPIKLHKSIEAMKLDLARLKNQSVAGKKSSTCSKRAKVVGKLANSQCRLNMILFGQLYLKKSVKSYKFLKNTLSTLQNVESGSFICAATYLQLVHHYNIIFAAYTPKDLPELMRECMMRPPLHKNITPKPKSGPNSNYRNFINSINSFNLNAVRNKNHKPSATVAGPTDSPNTHNDGISAYSLEKRRESSRPGLNAYENCSGVENQFVVPETGINETNQNQNQNLNLNANSNLNILPAAEIPSLMGLKLLDNDCYNTEYNSVVNSYSQRRGNELENYHEQQVNYIALDNHNLRNDDYSVDRDYNNFGNDYFVNRKSHGRTYNERSGGAERRRGRSKSRNRGITDSAKERRKIISSSPRNGGMNETVSENGPENNPRIDHMIDSSSFLERSRWGEAYNNTHCNISGQDMFYSDRRATGLTEAEGKSSRNDFPNLGEVVHSLPHNELEGRENMRYDDDPSTSTGSHNNQFRINIDNNNPVTPQSSIDQRKYSGHNKSKKNKKKKHKNEPPREGTRLHLYLQRRATKNIAKYIDMGYPRITQAAKALQKQLSDKRLTRRCIRKFEVLVKHNLKKK